MTIGSNIPNVLLGALVLSEKGSGKRTPAWFAVENVVSKRTSTVDARSSLYRRGAIGHGSPEGAQ